jgi:hypothetical protein
MCGPLLAPIALATSVAGGAYSAVAQGRMNKQNAAFARYEAEQLKEIGRAGEARSRDRMDRLIARQRGQIAGRGIRLDSTSAQDLGEEAAAERFLEAQAQRFNTTSRVQAKTNEAAISDYAATTSRAGGFLGTATRALGRALDLWPQLQGA